MTDIERDEIREGIRAWALAAIRNDWFNESRWWTRLVNWWDFRFYGLFNEWYDEDEITASIAYYAGLDNLEGEPRASYEKKNRGRRQFRSGRKSGGPAPEKERS